MLPAEGGHLDWHSPVVETKEVQRTQRRTRQETSRRFGQGIGSTTTTKKAGRGHIHPVKSRSKGTWSDPPRYYNEPSTTPPLAPSPLRASDKVNFDPSDADDLTVGTVPKNEISYLSLCIAYSFGAVPALPRSVVEIKLTPLPAPSTLSNVDGGVIRTKRRPQNALYSGGGEHTGLHVDAYASYPEHGERNMHTYTSIPPYTARLFGSSLVDPSRRRRRSLGLGGKT